METNDTNVSQMQIGYTPCDQPAALLILRQDS